MNTYIPNEVSPPIPHTWVKKETKETQSNTSQSVSAARRHWFKVSSLAPYK